MSYATSKCDVCLNKDICKHYQYFRDNFEIVVEVKDCSKIRYDNTFGADLIKPFDTNKGNSGVMTIPAPKLKLNTPTPWEPYKDRTSAINKEEPRQYHDLKKIPDPLNPITATFSANSGITPVKIAKVVCERCKKEVPSTDIDNCVECGRPVCKDCGVAALGTTGKPEFTCEKCWSGTPDPDPNNPEEVKITYGEEEKEWNLEDFETDKEVKEEKKDESGSGEQVGNKSSNRKSKKK